MTLPENLASESVYSVNDEDIVDENETDTTLTLSKKKNYYEHTRQRDGFRVLLSQRTPQNFGGEARAWPKRRSEWKYGPRSGQLSLQRAKSQSHDHADMDLFAPSYMKNRTNILGEVTKYEAHLHTFCSALQLARC